MASSISTNTQPNAVDTAFMNRMSAGMAVAAGSGKVRLK